VAKTSDPISFQDVFRAELKAIRGREVGPGDSVINAAHEEGVTGLALSGGGIRSATFSLGVIQALAERRLLNRFDYLSTVSGGGYIGSWLSALIHREGKGDAARIEAAISPGVVADTGAGTKRGSAQGNEVEHGAIRFLRAYSNYLTPRVGLFSADTLAFGITYIRNLTLNLLVLLAFMGAALLVPLPLADLFRELRVAADSQLRLTWVGLVALGLSLVSVFFISLNISHLHRDDGHRFPWYTGQLSVVLLVALPLLTAAVLFSRFLWNNEAKISEWSVVFGALYPIAWLIAQAIGRALTARPAGMTKPTGFPEQGVASPAGTTAPRPAGNRSAGQRRLAIVLSALVAYVAGAGLLWLASGLFKFPGGELLSHWHLATWGPPLMLLIFSFAVVLQIGLMGASFHEAGREWWSRLGAWLIIVVAGWSTLFAISAYGEAVLALAELWVGDWLPEALASGWLASTVAGVLAGRSASTGGKGTNPRAEIIAKVAPYVFVVGLLILLAAALHFAILQYLDHWRFGQGGTMALCEQLLVGNDPVHRSMCVLQLGIDQAPLGAAFLVLLAVGLLLSWRVDINLFSMHMMYRNRLTRCYLGATNSDRQPEPFTGFDENDDLPLGALVQPREGSSTIQRPYHIVNAALNLVRGRQLAWQQRKAASFVFTPQYCGYLLTDPPKPNPPEIFARLRAGVYRPTFEFASGGGGMKLGAAFAISGAAASPNMGYHSSPPLAFLLTVFNVRLGKWCGNTVDRQTWRRKGPSGGLYLFMELFGMTDERSRFVYLSDGGHFENMAIYELVRRRCKLIVACDCGADPKYTFDDLANAIRKCYTDFGIEIDIKVDRLGPDRAKDEESPHFAIGTIHYENVDKNAKPGKLVLLKPTLSGNEPRDVLSYAAANVEFPQQPTADQWFDEDQFESYRKLGYHVAGEMLDENPAGKLLGG